MLETKDDMVTDFKEWYSSEQMPILVCSQPKKMPLLRYIFSYSGDDNPYKQFMNQFKQLITLKDKFKVPVYFIAMRPGMTMSSHFIVGIIIDDQLIIVNPLGEEKQQDFYKILFKLKEQKWVKFFSISNTDVQRDRDGIISCGPICVELFNHLTSLSKEAILKMAQGLKSSFTQKKLEYSEKELKDYSLTNAEVTLPYNSINISEYLPNQLKVLLHSNPEQYLNQLQAIRSNHKETLQKSTQNVWSAEQRLIFKMLAETLDSIEKETDYLVLDAELKRLNLVKQIHPSNANALEKSLLPSQIESDSLLAWRLQAEEYKRVFQETTMSLSFLSSQKSMLSSYQFQGLQGEAISFILRPTSIDGDCFFDAVNKVSFTRDVLVKKLLDNPTEAVRTVFAHEIRQFLYLGYAGSHPNKEENEACQQLLASEIRLLFFALHGAEVAFRPKVEEARSELGVRETHQKQPVELLALLRKRNSRLTQGFEQGYQAVLNADKAIYEYCCQGDVFKRYVELYLKEARGYIPFSRDFGREMSTTTIDVINQLFGLKIQVYLSRNQGGKLLQLANQLQTGEMISIFHNGINHFWGLEKQEPRIEPDLLIHVDDEAKRKNFEDSSNVVKLEEAMRKLSLPLEGKNILDNKPYLKSDHLIPGLKGTTYQVAVLMKYAFTAYKEKRDFELLTEAEDFEKFDDLVIYYEDRIEVAQIKHGHSSESEYALKDFIDDPTKKEKKVQLSKYFDAWFKIKHRPKNNGKRIIYKLISNYKIAMNLHGILEKGKFSDDFIKNNRNLLSQENAQYRAEIIDSIKKYSIAFSVESKLRDIRIILNPSVTFEKLRVSEILKPNFKIRGQDDWQVFLSAFIVYEDCNTAKLVKSFEEQWCFIGKTIPETIRITVPEIDTLKSKISATFGCSLRLMPNGIGNFSDAIKREGEIIVVKNNGEFIIFCKNRDNGKIEYFSCSEDLKKLLLSLKLTFNGEILVKNKKFSKLYNLVYEEVKSREGCTQIFDGCFLNFENILNFSNNYLAALLCAGYVELEKETGLYKFNEKFITDTNITSLQKYFRSKLVNVIKETKSLNDSPKFDGHIQDFLSEFIFEVDQLSVESLEEWLKQEVLCHFNTVFSDHYELFYVHMLQWLRDSKYTQTQKTLSEIFREANARLPWYYLTKVTDKYIKNKKLERDKKFLLDATLYNESDFQDFSNFMHSKENNCLLIRGNSSFANTTFVRDFLTEKNVLQKEGEWLFFPAKKILSSENFYSALLLLFSKGLKYIILDRAEGILSEENAEYFKVFLKELISKGKKLILVVTSLNASIRSFIETNNDIKVLDMLSLSQAQIKKVQNAYEGIDTFSLFGRKFSVSYLSQGDKLSLFRCFGNLDCLVKTLDFERSRRSSLIQAEESELIPYQVPHIYESRLTYDLKQILDTINEQGCLIQLKAKIELEAESFIQKLNSSSKTYSYLEIDKIDFGLEKKEFEENQGFFIDASQYNGRELDEKLIQFICKYARNKKIIVFLSKETQFFDVKSCENTFQMFLIEPEKNICVVENQNTKISLVSDKSCKWDYGEYQTILRKPIGSNRVVVQSKAGLGKSRLCQEILKASRNMAEASNDLYHFVFLFDLSELSITDLNCLRENSISTLFSLITQKILEKNEITIWQEVLLKQALHEGQVLMIYDGLDAIYYP